MDALTSSMEDYLMAIWILGLEKRAVRVKNVSKFLRVKTSSVVSAIKILSGKELVHQEPYGYNRAQAKGNSRGKGDLRKTQNAF